MQNSDIISIISIIVEILSIIVAVISLIVAKKADKNAKEAISIVKSNINSIDIKNQNNRGTIIGVQNNGRK